MKILALILWIIGGAPLLAYSEGLNVPVPPSFQYIDVNFGDSETGDSCGNLCDPAPEATPRLKIYTRVSCFSHNTRHTSTKMPTDIDGAIIEIEANMEGGDKKTIQVRIPAQTFFASRKRAGSPIGLKDCSVNEFFRYLSGGKASTLTSSCQTFIQNSGIKPISTSTSFDSSLFQGTSTAYTGVIKKKIKRNTAGFLFTTYPKVKSISGMKYYYFYKRNGVITKSRITVEEQYKTSSFNKKTQTLNAYFSVAGGHPLCGPYRSPLMVFYDNRRPEFLSASRFPIYGQKVYVHWPKANHPGYFLAIDRNGDKKITLSSELFRDRFKIKNGFEDLRSLDSNKDNVIDHLDKDFSKIVLWKDKNGNGIGESSELISLKEKKIRWISLNYRGPILKEYGDRAQEREYSHFGYLDKNGKFRARKVIDIWLSPASIPNLLSEKVKREAAGFSE